MEIGRDETAGTVCWEIRTQFTSGKASPSATSVVDTNQRTIPRHRGLEAGVEIGDRQAERAVRAASKERKCKGKSKAHSVAGGSDLQGSAHTRRFAPPAPL